MNEREAVAYIEEWDVTEAAKVLKWYEEEELLRPCDCDAMVAIETEDLKAENAKLRELVLAIREGFVVAVDEWETWELRSCFHDDEKYRDYKEQFATIRQYYDEAMGEMGIEVPE